MTTETPNTLATQETTEIISEFVGGAKNDVSMMIGVGLVKESDAVYFQYVGEDANPQAITYEKTGKPVTRLANVRLSGISIAEDIGEFKSTKLNLYLTSNQGRTVMLTSGLKTIWSQCILTGLMGLSNKYDLTETVFTLDTWKGNSKMKPCFGAIRTGGQKVSDQVMYELLREARSDRDDQKVMSILREAVDALNAAVEAEEVVISVEDTTTSEEF